MSIIVLGISHHTVPVPVRERFAFAEADIPGGLGRLRAGGVIREAVILSTCNRVEIYAESDAPPAECGAILETFFLRRETVPPEGGLYVRSEPASLEHLFRVASGLDSMILGETEILGQLKQAYELALRHGHTGRRLNKAFQKAFNVAKLIRSQTGIQRGSVSVASAAVELAGRIFDPLDGRCVLVLGAGDTSEKTARALLSRGVKRLLVSNRSPERARELAAALGGQALPFDDWTAEFGGVDIIISSTASPRPILDRARLEPLLRKRPARPLLLIDIAVPRDIAPDAGGLDDVFLCNIDDLQLIADACRRRREEEAARCEALIREAAGELSASFRSSPDAPPASASVESSSP